MKESLRLLILVHSYICVGVAQPVTSGHKIKGEGWKIWNASGHSLPIKCLHFGSIKESEDNENMHIILWKHREHSF